MVNKIGLDDVYFFMYYDEEEKEISVSVAESLEEFKAVSEAFDIVAWCNVTGKDMEVGNINIQDTIKIFTVEDGGSSVESIVSARNKFKIREEREQEDEEGTGTT